MSVWPRQECYHRKSGTPKTKNIHHLREGREESIMNSPNSTSDSSSWNQLGSLGVPTTDVTAEGGVDPGSISPTETRLRGIDIQTPETIDNTLVRPVQIHPRYISGMYLYWPDQCIVYSFWSLDVYPSQPSLGGGDGSWIHSTFCSDISGRNSKRA